MLKRKIWTTAMALLCLAGSARAQDAVDAPPAAPEYKLNPQDQVSFYVEEDPAKPNQTVTYNVSALGDLRLPVSQGHSDMVTVAAKGRTLAELQGAITETLEKDYYYKATVHLHLERQRVALGKVYFFGEVKGVIQLPPGETKKLSEAVLELGHTDFADLKKVVVQRVNPVTGEREQIPVNVLNVLQPGKGKPADDFELQDDDRVHVPERSILFFNQIK